MNWRRIASLLACPDCRAALDCADQIVCRHCNRTFPIIDDIPHLLPRALTTSEHRTHRHFTQEFTASAGQLRRVSNEDRYFFFSRSGLDQKASEASPATFYPERVPSYTPDVSALKDKYVLDAGCGSGRFTRVAAESAKMVIGMDLGEHIGRAAVESSEFDNVVFIRGSVLSPPFRPGAFDIVFSIGVIHHTPDPRTAVLRLAELINPDGTLSVWVYPPEYWGGPIRGPVNRAMNRILRSMSPTSSHWVCRNLLYPAGRVQALLAKRQWTKMLTAPLFLISIPRHHDRDVMIATIHDYFGPQIISVHRAGELMDWFLHAGLDPQPLPVPSSTMGRRRQTHR